MAVLKWIDYIWFVGESFHRWEKSPGDGAALIMWCWYLDVAMILFTLFHRIAGGGIIFGHCPFPAGCAFPFLPFQVHGKASGQDLCKIFRQKDGKAVIGDIGCDSRHILP